MRDQAMESIRGESIFIEHTREKLLNAIIFFLKKTQKCGKLKLLKLLYFLDFIHFKQTGRSVTGLKYFAWEKGPVPPDLFYELGDPKDDLRDHVAILPSAPGEFLQMKPRKKFDPKFFSKRELRIMTKIADIFKEANADDMMEVSHLPNEPWDKTKKSKGLSSEIDYMLSLDNTRESLSIERVQEILKEREEVRSLFYQ
jgi:uncharacterized phage-associated protein